jgi:hypothetical protein
LDHVFLSSYAFVLRVKEGDIAVSNRGGKKLSRIRKSTESDVGGLFDVEVHLVRARDRPACLPDIFEADVLNRVLSVKAAYQ